MSTRSPLRRFWLIAAGALLLILLVLFWNALFHGWTFYTRDLASYYRPAKTLIVPLARASGGVPLWNPLFGSGQPFAANPEHELFHPLTTLFFLLPFEWAFRLQVILPLLAAAACMFLFLRTLRRSRAAALAVALSWGFGGYLLSTTSLLPILFAASIIPLSLTFVVRLLREPRLSDVAGLALSFGLQCLAGEPSTLLAMPLLGAAAALGERRTLRARGVQALALGLVLGAAIGAVTLVPGAHHAGRTVRALGLGSDAADQWSMPAVRGLDLLAPHVLGHVSLGEPARYWGRALYGEPIFPYLPSLYPGLLLTLVGLLACCWRRRVLWPWAAVAAVGFLVALGSHFPLWHLVRRLPLLSGVRFPEKFALLVAFPLLVAAAYGFDLVTLGPEKARRLLVRVAGVLLAAGLLLTGLLVIWPARLGPGFPAREAAGDALRLAIVAFVTMGALWIGRRLGRRNGALVLCAVGALDLATAGRDLVPQTPLANLTTPPAFLRPLVAQARDDVIVHLAAWKKNPRVHSRLAKPPIPAQWGLAMTLESDFDLTQLRWTTRSTAAFLEATEGNPALAEALLERRGVSAVVQIREGLTGPGGAAPDATGPADLQTIAAEHVRPIAFAVARVAIVHGEAGWRDAVRRLGRDAANAACVEDTELAAFPERPSPARVRVATRTPMRVVLVVDAQGPEPSFVAVNQTWDDGWRALIDGKPTRLLRTDLSLSGLVVPPGRHQIELTYQNDLVDLGVGISVTALVACLVLVLLGRRGRARRT